LLFWHKPTYQHKNIARVTNADIPETKCGMPWAHKLDLKLRIKIRF